MKKIKLGGIMIAICLLAIAIIPNFYAAGNTIDVRPGNGTLNDAISKAQAGDTIRLVGDGRYTGSKIVLDKDIKIVGTSNARNYVSNLFEINGASNVTFENLSLDAGAMITNQKNHYILDVKAKTNLTINNVNISYATRTDSNGKFTADVKNIYLEEGSDGTVVDIKNSIVGGIYNAIIVESSDNTINAEKTDIGGNVAIALRNGSNNKVYIKNNSKLSGRSYFVANSEECISIVGQENLVMEISDSEIFGVAVSDRNGGDIPAHLISFDDEASNNVNIKVTGNSKIEDDDKVGDSNIINFGDYITPESKVSVLIEKSVEIIPDDIDEKYNASENYVVVGIKDYKGDWTIKPYDKNQPIPEADVPKNDVEGYRLENITYNTQNSKDQEYISSMSISENTDIISHYLKLLDIKIDGSEQVFHLEQNQTLGNLKENEEAVSALNALKNPSDEKEFKNYVVSYTTDEGEEHTDVVQDTQDDYKFVKDCTISADYINKVKVTLKVDNDTRITKYINEGQSLNDLSPEDKEEFENAVKNDKKRFKEYIELIDDQEQSDPIPATQPIYKDITIVAKYEVDVKIGEDTFTIDEGATLQSLNPEDTQKLNAHKTAEGKDFKNFVKSEEGVEKEEIEETTPITEHTDIVAKFTIKVTISGNEYVLDEGKTLQDLIDENVEAGDALSALENVENKNFKEYVDGEGNSLTINDSLNKHTEISPTYTVTVTIGEETFTLNENESLSDLSEEDAQRLASLKTERFSRFVDEEGNTVEENSQISKNTELNIKNNVVITIGESDQFTLEEGKKLTDLSPEDTEKLNQIKDKHETWETFIGFKKSGTEEFIVEDETTFNEDTTLEPVYEILKGDIDRNGIVDPVDASAVLDRYKYSNSSQDDLKIADMDGNGILDPIDASMILDVYKYN